MPRYKKVNALYAVCRAIVYKVLRLVIKPPNISVLSLFATEAVISAADPNINKRGLAPISVLNAQQQGYVVQREAVRVFARAVKLMVSVYYRGYLVLSAFKMLNPPSLLLAGACCPIAIRFTRLCGIFHLIAAKHNIVVRVIKELFKLVPFALIELRRAV